MPERMKFWKSGLSFRIFICFLCLVVFPVYLLFFSLKSRFEDFIYQKISANVSKTIYNGQTEMEDLIEVMMNLSNAFAMDSELFVRGQQDRGDILARSKSFDRLMNGISNANAVVGKALEVTFVDVDHNQFTSWDDNLFLKDEELEPWLERAVSEKGSIFWEVFTPSFITGDQQEKLISMVRALYYQNSYSLEYAGTVIISVRQSYLAEILEKYRFEEDLVVIGDEDGNTYLSLPEGTAILPEQLKMDQQKPEGIYQESFIGDKTYLVNSYSLPPYWKTAGKSLFAFYYTNSDTIRNEFKDFNRLMTSILVFSSVVVILICAYISMKLVEPIKTLTANMRTYALKRKILQVDTARKDEIGELNRSFTDMTAQIDRLIEDMAEESRFKEKYYYESLMAQLNPHFLFNTLTTIRWMAVIKKEDSIVNCIDALANMLKYTMNKEGEIVTVEDELFQSENYIHLQNYRYGGQMAIHIDMDDTIRKMKMIKFCLQPIVENSAKHAFKEQNGHGDIFITGEVKERKLFLSVRDNGAGISAERLSYLQKQVLDQVKAEHVTGIGLSHVNRRIKILYGEEYGITIDSREGEYALVTFCLPVLKEGSEL